MRLRLSPANLMVYYGMPLIGLTCNYFSSPLAARNSTYDHLFKAIHSVHIKTTLFRYAQFSQRSPFGSTEPPSWVYVAVNQRQS